MVSNSPNLVLARQLDSSDELSSFRDKFHIPQHNGSDCLYFTGNSLGLQPRSASDALKTELDDWAIHGVEGHFKARNPWMHYHELFSTHLSKLAGTLPSEVVAMNALTVNLHLLLVSFYRPKGNRKKILCEAKAFPSDRYALLSQIDFHDGNPDLDLIELEPREGEHCLRLEDIEKAIFDIGEELATVMIGGVNYYTGQLHDLKSITSAAHKVGATCGFDLAHGMGNVPFELHNWNVDFACWCSYKYMNSGPGAVSGIYVHERHHNSGIPRLEGWWGHEKSSRFKMDPNYVSMGTAESWQMSNAPVLNMAVHKASLEIFEEAGGINKLRERSLRLTAFLEKIVREVAYSTDVNLEIITPSSPEKRGAQLSIIAHGQGRDLYDRLSSQGVVVDWREPDVIRMAPVPLYNSFEDIARFGIILEEALINPRT
ncbi:MAG: kynureninase [Bacteroidetes bacterium]|nr:MAG: kynureninase [Bacteroidota bacterium]